MPAAAAVNRYGLSRVAGPAGGGQAGDIEVWAARYDRRVAATAEADAPIQSRFTTYTIRARADVDEDTVVVDGGLEYSLLGPPLRRGEGGAEYFQLDAVRKE